MMKGTFFHLENITFFIAFAKKSGVSKFDLFDPKDLTEEKGNFEKVSETTSHPQSVYSSNSNKLSFKGSHHIGHLAQVAQQSTTTPTIKYVQYHLKHKKKKKSIEYIMLNVFTK